MRPSKQFYLHVYYFATIKARRTLYHKLGRKLVCLALVFSLLILPALELAKQLPALAMATTKITSSSLLQLTQSLKSLFVTSAAPQRPDMLEDRLFAVSRIQITPVKMVGYQGQTVSFTALATDVAGQTI